MATQPYKRSDDMVLEFMTKRNLNGHRQYLAINTETRVYSMECPFMVMDGIEVKSRDYKSLVNDLDKNG